MPVIAGWGFLVSTFRLLKRGSLFAMVLLNKKAPVLFIHRTGALGYSKFLTNITGIGGAFAAGGKGEHDLVL